MDTGTPLSSDARQERRWVTAAVATSVLLRLRFLAQPLGVDEAGAIVVARSWASGHSLYGDTFIDRPQGVVVLFQRWDSIAGAHPSSARLLAVLAGVAIVLGAAVTARTIARCWQAGAAAAWLAAVLTATAAFEGYAANGELLAGAFTVPATAIGALVITGRWSPPWLVVAGALASVGLSMKQSAFDVLIALAVWLVLAAVLRWLPRHRALAALGWLCVGAGIVVGGLAWHGATLGWDRYAYAMVGFRLHARSAVASPQAQRLAITLAAALPLLVPTVLVAWHRVRARSRPLLGHLRPDHALVLLWLGVAASGFFLGGNYHRHYWIQLMFPFAVAAGIALAVDAPSPPVLRRSLAWALCLPFAVSLVLIAAPQIERDGRVDADAALARWVDDQAPEADAHLLTLCGSTTFYVDARQDPGYPYLWVDHVRAGRGATDRLVQFLDGSGRPRFIALHQPVDRCDPTGRVQAALDRNYEPTATVAGIEVLRATDEAPN